MRSTRSAVRHFDATLDRETRRSRNRPEPEGHRQCVGPRFVRHVRRTGRLLDRRRRIHAETIQRHPHQNTRRPRKSVRNRPDGHQSQRIFRKQRQGDLHPAQRQHHRTRRRRPDRLQYFAAAAVQQEFRTVGRRHHTKPRKRIRNFFPDRK